MTAPTRTLRRSRLPWQASIGGASALALVLVLVISPTTVEAAGALSTLRAPGEAGFIAGHRGDATAPENTLPAIRAAVAGPAQFVETDLQLTADGVPVLMHDWTVDRTTDGSGPVWSLTFEELRRLDAGSWFGLDYAGVRVPSFDEFLEVLRPSRKQAIIELKGSWTLQQAQGIADSVFAQGLQARVIFASFDLQTLQHLQRAAPELARAIITRKVVGDPAVLAAACGAIAIVTSEKFIRQHPDAVDRIHDAGLGVLLYTLNDATKWASAIELGVDGIITDVPGDLGSYLTGPGLRSRSGD